MYTRALYEGVIREGETRSGYVFFETVSRRERDLKLVASFPAMQSGKTVARIAVPLRVE
jgi:hypothetical protein